MIIIYNMNIITLYHGILDRMLHIQRTHPSTATTGPQGGVGGYHDQTMTGGVCDAEAYI